MVSADSLWNSNSVFAWGLTLRDDSKILLKSETLLGVGGDDDPVYVYDYDEAGRLIAVDGDGVAVETYAYDGNGNRMYSAVAQP